jgi:hypothetical protein
MAPWTRRPPSPEKGGFVVANKMEIVFFDELGFGWLMETEKLERIRDRDAIEQSLIKRSLAELFRRHKPV